MPLFVHRFARERLRALGQVRGTIAKPVPEVLFVCVQNAGRSQMAAALLDSLAEGRVPVRSAGSSPADQINPNVVTAMSELGIDSVAAATYAAAAGYTTLLWTLAAATLFAGLIAYRSERAAA